MVTRILIFLMTRRRADAPSTAQKSQIFTF